MVETNGLFGNKTAVCSYFFIFNVQTIVTQHLQGMYGCPCANLKDALTFSVFNRTTTSP